MQVSYLRFYHDNGHGNNVGIFHMYKLSLSNIVFFLWYSLTIANTNMFNLSDCTKPEKWVIMHICVLGYWYCLCLCDFFYRILELLWECVITCSSFCCKFSVMIHSHPTFLYVFNCSPSPSVFRSKSHEQWETRIVSTT